MLLRKHPDENLTKDVLLWDDLERDSSRCMSLVEYEEFSKQQHKDPLDIVADDLNRNFRDGVLAYKMVEDIRRFPRPICVDFNNTIASNRRRLKLNPAAPQFIHELKEIGNIFIVTDAKEWDWIHNFLVDHHLWSPGFVIMCWPNFEFLFSSCKQAKQLINEYIQQAANDGFKYYSGNLPLDRFEPYELFKGRKRIAPVFGKNFPVPIIDNDYENTRGNPGMLGIQVKWWEPDRQFRSVRRWMREESKAVYTLMEAVEIVRSHYSNI